MRALLALAALLSLAGAPPPSPPPPPPPPAAPALVVLRAACAARDPAAFAPQRLLARVSAAPAARAPPLRVLGFNGEAAFNIKDAAIEYITQSRVNAPARSNGIHYLN